MTRTIWYVQLKRIVKPTKPTIGATVKMVIKGSFMEMEKRHAKVENLWKDIGIRFKARINLNKSQ